VRIAYLEKQLQERQRKRGLEYVLVDGASGQDIADAQYRLGVVLPLGVRRFYSAHDGLMVASPPLDVFGLSRLRRTDFGIVFARFNGAQDVAFRVGAVNAAGEWDIVSVPSGFCVTKTMASFWSNKIFAWIDSRREVWAEEFVGKGHLPPG